jgi:hypothetical protein
MTFTKRVFIYTLGGVFIMANIGLIIIISLDLQTGVRPWSH